MRKEGYFTALVTGAQRRTVEHSVPEGLVNMLDVIITSDDVRRGKPNPDPYLKALQRVPSRDLILPRQCVVIENAPLGIISAKRAGMHCVAISTTLPPGLLESADYIVEDFRVIPSLIKKK